MGADMIAEIERAVRHDRVTSLVGTLAELYASGTFMRHSDLFAPPNPARYSRRLIWRDPAARFIVVGLTWLPGQRSPLHDHAGLWGAEIVVSGSMRETTYRLLERDASGRCRFSSESERELTQGSVGILIPPLEYHDFGNDGDTPCQTIHIYSGDLDHCYAYSADDNGNGWWHAKRIDLRYDA
jgi:3-mercaptopropionate dioxygenase